MHLTNYEEFTVFIQKFANRTEVSKSLSFSLIPVGNTRDAIDRNMVIEEALTIDQDLKTVKKIMDGFYRSYIERCLQDQQIPEELLYDYEQLKDEQKNLEVKYDKAFLKKLTDLEMQIKEHINVLLTKNDEYEHLFGIDFIGKNKEDGLLVKHLQSIGTPEALSDIDVVRSMCNKIGFLSKYFTGVKFIIGSFEKVGCVPYRLINDNLPIFYKNKQILQMYQDNHPALYSQIEKHLQKHFENSEKINFSDMVHMKQYNKLLTQTGIEQYNALIGGYVVEKDGCIDHIHGINNLVHEYVSDHEVVIPKLATLKKQILVSANKANLFGDTLVDDLQTITVLEQLAATVEGPLEHLSRLLQEIQDYNTDQIFFDEKQLAKVSHLVYGNHAVLRNVINYYHDNVIIPNYADELESAKASKKSKLVAQKTVFMNAPKSVQELDCMVGYFVEQNKGSDDAQIIGKKRVVTSLSEQYKQVSLIVTKHQKLSEYFGAFKESGTSDMQKHRQSGVVVSIKEYLDALIAFTHTLNLFKLSDAQMLDLDSAFYSAFDVNYAEIKPVFKTYNAVRNYITKKPGLVKKSRLFFGTASLLSGWSQSKESTNKGILLRKNGDYFLGILNKPNLIESIISQTGKSEEVYEKMVMDFLPNPHQMLPKVFFSRKGLEFYNPPADILKIYESKKHIKSSKNFDIKACHKLIDWFKQAIAMNDDWAVFQFKFSNTDTYSDISDFYNEVACQGYKVNFVQLDSSLVDEAVEKGDLYLFQIYNKDFSKSKLNDTVGNPNLFTLYFNELFSDENLKEVMYKLSGGASIYYRPAVLDVSNVAKHKKDEKLVNKNPLNPSEKTAKYTIYKDKRYTKEGFYLSIPITINYGASVKAFNQKVLNTEVRECLRADHSINIIGIDRGENSLVNFVVIDQKGRILHQESLNEIKSGAGQGVVNTVDYRQLIRDKANLRKEQAQDWQHISTSAELKDGYLSQVIYRLCNLIKEYNAVVVMEDLESSLNGRAYIETNVYKKFETKLVNKLSLYIDKHAPKDEPASIRKPLSLALPDVQGKQNGVLFKVPTHYTTNIDFTTGFVDLIYPSYKSMKQFKTLLDKFDAIKYNQFENHFEFSLDYKKFDVAIKNYPNKWLVCTPTNNRLVHKDDSMVDISLTEALKQLLRQYDIDFSSGKCLKDKILAISNSAFFKEFGFVLMNTFRMKQYVRHQDERQFNYLSSPVKNKHGGFFDTRYAKTNEPQDCYMNSAYHIALKGLMMINQIQDADNVDSIKLDVKKETWLSFVANRNS